MSITKRINIVDEITKRMTAVQKKKFAAGFLTKDEKIQLVEKVIPPPSLGEQIIEEESVLENNIKILNELGDSDFYRYESIKYYMDEFRNDIIKHVDFSYSINPIKFIYDKYISFQVIFIFGSRAAGLITYSKIYKFKKG